MDTDCCQVIYDLCQFEDRELLLTIIVLAKIGCKYGRYANNIGDLDLDTTITWNMGENSPLFSMLLLYKSEVL